MTPKEKAIELVDKYYIICQEFTEEIQCSIQAKQCALIAIEEILQSDGWSSSRLEWDMYASYWNKVKHEIEKI
jgi:hypothetical protein